VRDILFAPPAALSPTELTAIAAGIYDLQPLAFFGHLRLQHSMGLSGVRQFLWAASFSSTSVLLAVLLLRRRAASLSAFTFLIAFYVAKTLVLFSLAVHFSIRSRPYALTYWSLSYVDDAIQFAVFYELVKQVFCPTGVWARDARRAFQWLVAASILLALGLAMLASPPTARWYETYLLRSNFFVSVLESGLFVGIMVLSSTVGLPWKTHAARVAQGFGACALTSMVLEGTRNYFGLGPGQRAYGVVAYIETVIYIGCMGFWIVSLWQEAPAPRELPDAMLMQIYTLQRRVENDLVRIRNWRRS